MANQIKLESGWLDKLITQLDAADADVERIVGRMMRETAHKIALDTKKGLSKANLPAQGTYSIGTTSRSVAYFPQVEWNGLIASIPVGFDFSVAGAGGFLISGTPRHQPDKVLHDMYKNKKYMAAVHQDMWDSLWTSLEATLNG